MLPLFTVTPEHLVAKNLGLDTSDVAIAFEKCGTVTKTAQYMGVARSTVREHLLKLGINGREFAGGTLDGDVKEEALPLPAEGEVFRYLLTCAQSNTYLNDQVWETLLQIKKYYGAELMVSRFSYNKSAYLNRGNLQKPGAFDDIDEDHAFTDDHKQWFDPRVVKYAQDGRYALAPGLVFCAEMNILPTAVRPLSSLETYTGRKSAVIPHVKFAMDSIASSNNEPAKFNYTTGTVTYKNYLQKKAGQKAEFHHCYGALLVEVDCQGDWWVRQLNADRQGRIYDVGDRQDGCILFDGREKKPKFKQRVEAINWGDIHVAEALYDPDTIEVNWGAGGMLDVLRPKYQFGHDTFSFLSRNHHDEKDSHRLFEKFINGEDGVEKELLLTGHFINLRMLREWCKVIIVDSNHDRALQKWLNSANYKTDPMNRIIFLELELRLSRAIQAKEQGFHLLEYALETHASVDPKVVRFLREDENFIICRDASGGIESGNHGHLGSNGAKPAPQQFAKMGRRQNTGHTHSAGIIDGVYTSGVTGKPKRFKYRKGPSSWSQSDIVTYPNGKRTIVTKWRNKYRAELIKLKRS